MAILMRGAKKLMFDVTSTEVVPLDYFQMTFAAVGEGMDYRSADAQRVEQDGEPHTITLDIGAWKLPENPSWMVCYIVTNTPENSTP